MAKKNALFSGGQEKDKVSGSKISKEIRYFCSVKEELRIW